MGTEMGQETKQASGKKYRFLIADDDSANRLVLSSMLKKMGHEVLQTENGQQAIDMYQDEAPDMILMDVMMPVMNGYDATKIIKEMEQPSNFTPIIFLTAITDEAGLSKCIEYGGDDFLTKPINFVILKAKIDALMRVRKLYIELNRTKQEIEIHHNRLQQEHIIAENVLSKVTKKHLLDDAQIKYIIRPQSISSGDILLASKTPSGSLMYMLGDFTGHGLSAAIGALPASDIFYAMAKKGFSVSQIAKSINNKLNDVLPTGLYLAAIIIDIDYSDNYLTIWGGGLPDTLIQRGDEIIKVPSKNLPLGILNESSFDSTAIVVPCHDGDRIFSYSDGITEAIDINETAFGEDTLINIIKQFSAENDQVFTAILNQLDKHTEGQEQDDDITLSMVDFISTSNTPRELENTKIDVTKWSESLYLDSAAIRDHDTVKTLAETAIQLPGLYQYRREIFLIYNELYNNALEHGVLTMNNEKKSTADGFYEFYDERARKLEQISDDSFIRIETHYQRQEKQCCLSIKISNSGDNTEAMITSPELNNNDSLHGRGLNLIRHFSDSFDFNPSNNTFSVSLTYTI